MPLLQRCAEEQGFAPTQVVLDSPIIQHCPALVFIPGTIPACTLYKKVKVILETMAKGQNTCQYQTVRSVLIKKAVSIQLLNDTHGSFIATFDKKEYNAAYCLCVSVGECGVFILVLSL